MKRFHSGDGGGRAPNRAAARRGSAVRVWIGAMLLLVSFVVIGYGFLKLAGVLASGGYGIPAVRDALIVLGAAGGLLALGISLIIWDISLRYEESVTANRHSVPGSAGRHTRAS